MRTHTLSLKLKSGTQQTHSKIHWKSLARCPQSISGSLTQVRLSPGSGVYTAGHLSITRTRQHNTHTNKKKAASISTVDNKHSIAQHHSRRIINRAIPN